MISLASDTPEEFSAQISDTKETGRISITIRGITVVIQIKKSDDSSSIHISGSQMNDDVFGLLMHADFALELATHCVANYNHLCVSDIQHQIKYLNRVQSS